MKNGQLEVIDGQTTLGVEVRGVSFDVMVTRREDGWDWVVRHQYDDAAEPCGDTAKTWATALRSALRACDGMAPFRKYERRSTKGEK